MQFINEAGWDRILRIVAGAVILYLGFGGVVTGGWGTFLKIFGFLPLLTGLFGFCPAYALFGVGTRKSGDRGAAPQEN